MSPVTIQDVAQYAQVSRATVSRVLNHNATVDPILRDRVLEAVQALGYQPNRAARRLRTQSRDVIGLLVADITNPFFISVLKGIEDTAYSHNINVLLCNTNEDPDRFQRYLQLMRAESVAGLIVVPTKAEDSAALCALQADGISIVLLDRAIDGLDVDVVKVDNYMGSYDGVQHLIQLGHRRIAIVFPDVSTGHERFEGYAAALHDAGLEIEQDYVKIADYHAESSYQLTKVLFTLPHPPDAIFTGTNLMTLGAFRALREQHLLVPQDVAILGFDDIPWAEDLYCPLTVVRQPTYDLGCHAVNHLIRRLDKPKSPYQITTLPTEMIVRESCGIHLNRR